MRSGNDVKLSIIKLMKKVAPLGRVLAIILITEIGFSKNKFTIWTSVDDKVKTKNTLKNKKKKYFPIVAISTLLYVRSP